MSKFVFDFGLFWAPFWSLLGRLWGAKLAPKSVKKSTSNCKTALGRFLGDLGAIFGLSWAVLGRSWGAGRFLDDSLSDFGANLAPKRRPKSDQNGTQNGPKSKTNFDIEKEALQDRLGAVLGRSWADLGLVLGSISVKKPWKT